MRRLIPDFTLHAPDSEIQEVNDNPMRVDVQEDIIEQLQANQRLSFGDLKARTGWNGHDVRAAMKELIEEDSGVYVQGVEDKQKFYSYR